MKLRSGVKRIFSSLTKGVLNLPPHYMPKHVSGDTDVDTTLRNKKIKRVFIHGVVAIFAPKKIPFGLGGDQDL
jgi:hypothetical protein